MPIYGVTERWKGKAMTTCRECLQNFKAKTTAAQFCGAPCRSGFNNRRKRRGAELYDLFMAMRHQRADAKEAGTWKRLCRLAQSFRAEDEQEGRTSYDLTEAMARTAHYGATVVGINIAGNPI